MQRSRNIPAMFMHSSCERLRCVVRRAARRVARHMGQACCLVLGAAAPAVAATFTPPEGCTLTMTVQQRSCTVAQHYTCAADPAGDQWVTYFTREGQVYESRIDAETRWMLSSDLINGITDRLEPGAADDASLRTLLTTGRDAFDFWTISDTGERFRYVGSDEITGSATIDGVPLQTTRFQLRGFDAAGELMFERSGSQFVSGELGRFYGGIERGVDRDGERHESDDTPVRFIRPGQPGFGSTDPQYDCEAQMVGRPGGNGA